MKLTVAFSTDDGDFFNNDHFGMARYFRIYEFSESTEAFIEMRENVKYIEDQSIKHGDPGKAKATSSVLGGVDVIAGRKFGPNIVRLLKKFVCVAVKTDRIADAIQMIQENMEVIEEAKSEGDTRKHIVLKRPVKG